MVRIRTANKASGRFEGAVRITKSGIERIHKAAVAEITEDEVRGKEINTNVTFYLTDGSSQESDWDKLDELSASGGDLLRVRIETVADFSTFATVEYDKKYSHLDYSFSCINNKKLQSICLPILKSWMSNHSFLYGKMRIPAYVLLYFGSVYSLGLAYHIVKYSLWESVYSNVWILFSIFVPPFLLLFLHYSRVFAPNLEADFGLDLLHQEKRNQLWKLLGAVLTGLIAGVAATAAVYEQMK